MVTDFLCAGLPVALALLISIGVKPATLTLRAPSLGVGSGRPA